MTGVAGPCGVRAGWSPPRIIQPSTATTLTAPGRCWPSRETPSPWCSPTFSWRTTMICWRSAARRDLRSGEWPASSTLRAGKKKNELRKRKEDVHSLLTCRHERMWCCSATKAVCWLTPSFDPFFCLYVFFTETQTQTAASDFLSFFVMH